MGFFGIGLRGCVIGRLKLVGKVTEKREQCKRKTPVFRFALPSASNFGEAKVTEKREKNKTSSLVFVTSSSTHRLKLENFNRSIHLQNRVGAQKTVPRRKNRVLAAFSVGRCVPALLVLEQL